MLNMFVIRYTSISPNFIFILLRVQKNKQKCNYHYEAISMMMLQILKFLDFTKTQKRRYLENETLFFLQIKKIINYTESFHIKSLNFSKVSMVTFSDFPETLWLWSMPYPMKILKIWTSNYLPFPRYSHPKIAPLSENWPP